MTTSLAHPLLTRTSAPRTAPGRLVDLPEAEAWELAASLPVGRLAWSGPDGITVLPVNIAVDAVARTVLVRTTPYTPWVRQVVDRPVAIEVDLLDPVHHGGWSVLLRGRCTRQERPPTGTDLARLVSPVPWATGPRLLELRVDVAQVSARRLEPAR